MRQSQRLWQRHLSELVALLVVAIWGAGFAITKFALDQFNVPAFMSLRYLGMLALSWGVLAWRIRRTGESFRTARVDFARLSLAALRGHSSYITRSTVRFSTTT